MLGGKKSGVLPKFWVSNRFASYICIYVSILLSIDRFIFCLSPSSSSPYHADWKDLRGLSQIQHWNPSTSRGRENPLQLGGWEKNKLLHRWMQQEKTGLQWSMFCYKMKALPEQLFHPYTTRSTVDVWVISTRALRPTCVSWGFFTHLSSTREKSVCTIPYFDRKKLAWDFL